MSDMFQRMPVKCSEDFNVFFVKEFDCFCEVSESVTEQVITFLKNPAFEEEKEVRIVYYTGIYDDIETRELAEILKRKIEIGKNKKLILQSIQHQVKGNKLVAYADLNFEKCIASGIINEIVIGLVIARAPTKDGNKIEYYNLDSYFSIAEMLNVLGLHGDKIEKRMIQMPLMFVGTLRIVMIISEVI